MGWWGKNLPQKAELPIAVSTRKVMIASPKPGAAFLQAKLEQESGKVRKAAVMRNILQILRINPSRC